MYLSKLTISGFRQFGLGPNAVSLPLKPGVTALIGKNDSGKTAIIDAIRYALLSRDQMYIRVQPEDFHVDENGTTADDINIACILSDLSVSDQAAFAEYLTFQDGIISLVINFHARRLTNDGTSRRWVEVNVRSGLNAAGPTIEMTVRELLASAYLKPLRDAEGELSSGRGSRLSQILYHVDGIKNGADFDAAQLPPTPADVADLSLLGLSEFFSHNVKGHKGVVDAETAINTDYLKTLLLVGDEMAAKIDLTEGGSNDARLRQILERLELGLMGNAGTQPRGKFGLGSNNILYMACELLLLGREPEGLPLLLIEEPEAHLHPQRQLRLMQFLKRAATGKVTDEEGRKVQVILSTHSPNLASGLPVVNTILLDGNTAHPLSEEHTKLSTNDYSFLERFLDVTKANLFFAHGILIVEGDGEALVLPAIARALNLDLEEHGVSIVNVKGTGLRRFSKIFQRADETEPWISIPVACLADIDVMPDAAPKILGIVNDNEDPKWDNPKRRWKAKRDLGPNAPAISAALLERTEHLKRDDAQNVETFVSEDHANYLERCHAAGQTRPTPLLLQYVEDNFNCLHQDVYGDLVFPLQVAVLLSRPEQDFTGGEFVLTEQRPRMQSRAEVVPLNQGDAIIFAVRNRPVKGAKRDYRVNMHHGVSRLKKRETAYVGCNFSRREVSSRAYQNRECLYGFGMTALRKLHRSTQISYGCPQRAASQEE